MTGGGDVSPALVAFRAGIPEHVRLLRKRRIPMSAEDVPPIGQAAEWYADVCQCVPRSAKLVARQIARLCGDDAKVTTTWRSLADAVGVMDKAGRLMAYTQRGVEILVDVGWLRVETVGKKRGAKTTFWLLPGPMPWESNVPTAVDQMDTEELDLAPDLAEAA